MSKTKQINTEQQAIEAGTVLYEDRLSGGCHWSMIMRKGTSLRVVDEQGGANVGMLFYNPVNMLERFNAPDTLKMKTLTEMRRLKKERRGVATADKKQG